MTLLVMAAPAGAAVTAPTLPAGFEESSLAAGFTHPTAVAWAPDGRMFVAEKRGVLRVVGANGVLRTQPVLDFSTRVNTYSDRGFLGLALDRDFATNGWVYLLYVVDHPGGTDSSAPTTSRLTRITVNPDNTVANASNPETIILGTSTATQCPAPSNTSDCIPSDFYWHAIGSVRVDPADGTLWLGSGDGTYSEQPEDRTFETFDERSMRGKILHIGRDGRGLPGHPFCPNNADLTQVCTKVYAKGFRNPFRFFLRPGKGPVVGDVGLGTQEEVDLLRPGGNYGWPCYEGTGPQSIHRNDQRCLDLYAKEGTADAALAPAWSYAHGDGASVAAGYIYDGSSYPSSYVGDVLVADFVQGWIKRLDVNSSDQVTGETTFASWPEGTAALVDVEPQPGTRDLVYVDIGYAGNSNGVRKFRYTPDNASPVARASGTPTSGAAPLTVAFDASTSSDVDGDALTYDWDFGDGTAHGSGAKPTHTYSNVGSYTATVTVTDGRGGSSTATVGPITPGNTPPTVTISAPADGGNFRYGSSVSVGGAAQDAQDGALSGTALTWEIKQQHANHVHDLTSLTGATGSFTMGSDHDADSNLIITLTAKDSGGLTASKTVRIYPETIQLTLDSSPRGATMTYAGIDALAPTTRTAAIGYRAALSTSPSFVAGGATYRFERWSDGGAREHSITVPAADTTYTAVYNGLPTAAFTVNRNSGPAPLDVDFDGSTSADPDAGDTLTYAWDFGDGTPAGSGKTPSHRYASPGNYTARLTVTDPHGATATMTRTITANDTAPTPSTSGDSQFKSGTKITVTGSATDLQEGAIPASGLSWKVFRRRGADAPAQVATVTGSATAEYMPPTSTDTDTWFEFELTATDSKGNSASTTRRVDPKLVSLSVVSAPPGAQPSFAGTTTFPRSSVAGFVGTAATPATFTATSGVVYNFRRWSDGSTSASRSYTVPDATTATLTAEYNGLPTARFVATPDSGPAPLDVSLDASTSSDPEGAALTYSWSFGDGTPDATGRTVPTATHRYEVPGNYTARLTVTDAQGATATTTRPITSGNAAPNPSTAGDSQFKSGSEITVTGSATDAQDGTIPATGLSWKVFQNRGATRTEVHTVTGSATAKYTPPASTDIDSWYEFELTATDSGGASRTATRRVDPKLASVTVNSSPSGATLSFPAGNSMFPRSSVVGFTATAAAADASFVKDGDTYRFRRWSDGNVNRSRSYAVPDTASPTLTAEYNGDPTAAFSATPPAGPAPLDVSFDAGTSRDPDGGALTYSWNFGDGTPAGSGKTVSHRYTTAGSYTARLTVTDALGATATTTRTIAPGDTAPTATIDSPADGDRFDAGERVALAGHATDAQSTPTLSWRVLRWRGGASTPAATTGDAFTVPADPATDDWYEVALTATDSAGLTDTETRRVDPHTSNVRLVSEPDGIQLGWNGTALTAPAGALAVVGTRATIAAPAELERSGRRWLFGSWSDGGAREHTITVAGGDPELRTTFTLQDEPLPPPANQPGPADPEPGPGPQPQPEPELQLPPLVELRLARGGPKASTAGAIKISLRNRNKLASIGALELVTERPVRRGRGQAKRIVLGEAAFIVAPSATRTIVVRLSKANLKLVKQLRRVGVAVEWDAHDLTGRRGSGRSVSVLTAPRAGRR